MKTVLKISQHSNELMPTSEKVTINALRSLLSPMNLPYLMEHTDAKDLLNVVEKKVGTRAAKRKAAAEAAAACKNARLMERGAKRAATRANIAARPVPSKR